MTRGVIRFLVLLFAYLQFSLAQSEIAIPPKREVRAVWVTTTSGLDWPHSLNKAEQQASLHDIVSRLKTGNFNTIFFQVRARGDAYYRSRYEPWAENLTGTLGNDPGWDPLSFLLNEAHHAGIEVHAWFNVFRVNSHSRPEWSVQSGGEWWLDPGIPAVRAFVLNVVLDLLKNYDLDGVNFDFIRYPGRDFADNDTYRRYGNGDNKDDWRRANVTRFMNDAYDRLKAMKPMLKIGASPWGMFDRDVDGDRGGSYRSVYQDARKWIQNGKVDYLSPQLHWSLGGNGGAKGDPDFARLVRSWQKYSAGRHIYAGIAAYKPEVFRELPAEIDTARSRGALGEVFFRYENIRAMTMFDDRYHSPANIPPMDWKDALPPLPPGNLAVTEIATNVFQLEWSPPPPADDGDKPRYYNIYRYAASHIPFDDPRSLVAITSDNENSFIDTVRVPSGLTYYYAVTAFDKGNNESAPSNVATGVVRELLALKGRLPNFTTMTASIPHTAGGTALVAYTLSRRTPVALDLYRLKVSGTDSLFTPLVNGVQERGTYVVGVDPTTMAPGKYIVRLHAGEATVDQALDFSR